MYLYVCRYMYMFASVYGGQRSTLVVVPQELSSLLLETDSLMGPGASRLG